MIVKSWRAYWLNWYEATLENGENGGVKLKIYDDTSMCRLAYSSGFKAGLGSLNE